MNVAVLGGRRVVFLGGESVGGWVGFWVNVDVFWGEEVLVF